ncbi:FAD-dependent oxidoreductase [Arthrobacter yangruifuii]|uniref:FAD-dependent oxidoreductase n=1 Tax=Arthrobacter yangruifuii TaxID=2606616 RepID=A0A5N6MJ76_9MICC|nr:FAD-dependent monooxygenase [Arthrobacter yangruifuii]KAD3633181.1 FAD-dependent oxidoreductase [Arthrobacter yangruifuii]
MSTRENTTETDVVIVGAGPVGMTAAALLAARGIRVIILEQRLGTSDEPKAISVDDEALRTYQQAGIVDEICSIIVPGTGTRYYDADNEPLFQARAGVPYRLGHPFKNPFAQPDLERILAAFLDAHDLVTVHFGTRMTGLDEKDAQACVTAEADDGTKYFSAKFVLGADGGRSIVRELKFGNAMSGRSYPNVWLVADTLEDPHTERYGMHHGDPNRPHVIVPGLDGRCRYEFLLFEGEGQPGDIPDIELIRTLVAPYRAIEKHHIERSVNYRFNAVNADRYRAGRFFVLGDAAHMMPPFAGQGLNSGIRDSANLCWKIAEVIQGKAPDSILGTYEAERKPHAAAVIAQSIRLGSIVMTTNQRVARYRDDLVRRALGTEDGRAFLEEMRYRPIAHFGGELTATADAGYVIGQPLVYDTRSRSSNRLDEVVGTGWVLYGVDIDPAEWAKADALAARFDATRWHVPFGDTQPRTDAVDGVLIDLDGGLYREFGSFRNKFVLQRPDHFTSAVFAPSDIAAVLNATAVWRTEALTLNS